jgi:hypothetical protein
MIGDAGHIEVRGTIVAKAAPPPIVLASHDLSLTAMTFCTSITNDLVEDISYDRKDQGEYILLCSLLVAISIPFPPAR